MDTMVAYEQALLTDIELLRKHSSPDVAVHADDVTKLLAGYGTTFDALPHYLQAAIDRMDLAEQK